jgi:hypothetical protein
VQTEVADRRLVAVPFADGGHTEPLAIIHYRKKKLTPIMNKFIAFLKPPVPVTVRNPFACEGAWQSMPSN